MTNAPRSAPPLREPDPELLHTRLQCLRAALGAARLGLARRLALPGPSPQPFAVLAAVAESGPLWPVEDALPLAGFKLLIDEGRHVELSANGPHALAAWLRAQDAAVLRGWALPNDRLPCVLFLALFVAGREPGEGRLRVAEQGMEALARALAPPQWLLLPHPAQGPASAQRTAAAPADRNVRAHDAPALAQSRAPAGRRRAASRPRRPAEPAPGDAPLLLLGPSALAQELRQRARRAAASDEPLLLQAESGSEPVELARWLHAHSPRRAGPFVVLGCAGISRRRLERELFGVATRGRRTDAGWAGALEQAHGGSLMLEDVGELPRMLQERLLQALRCAEVTRVNEHVRRGVDVRVLASSRRNLRLDARRGRFLEDLYWHLAPCTLLLPPLRARAADVPALLGELVRTASGAPAALSVIEPAAAALLARCGWPGNLAQLRAEAARLAGLFGSCEALRADMLSEALRDGEGADAQGQLQQLLPLGTAYQVVEAIMIRRALRCTEGNKTAAAKALGLSRQGLYKMLRRHNLHARQDGNRSL